MAVKMAMRKGCGEHGWIAGRQAGRIPLGGCWKAVAGLLDFAGMFRLLLRGFILNHLFFFILSAVSSFPVNIHNFCYHE